MSTGRPKYYRETTIDYQQTKETILVPEKVDFFVDHPEEDLLANPLVPDKLVFLREDPERQVKFPNRFKDLPDKVEFFSEDPEEPVGTKVPTTLQNKQAEHFEDRYNRKSLTEAAIKAQLQRKPQDKMSFFTSHIEPTESEYFGSPENPISKSANRKSLTEAALKAQLNQQPTDKMTFFGNPSQAPPHRGSQGSKKTSLKQNSEGANLNESQSQAPAYETSQLGNPRVNRKSLAEAELRAQLNPELNDKINFFGNSTFETTQPTNTQINRKSLNEAQIKAQLNPENQDKLVFFGNEPTQEGNRKSLPEARRSFPKDTPNENRKSLPKDTQNENRKSLPKDTQNENRKSLPKDTPNENRKSLPKDAQNVQFSQQQQPLDNKGASYSQSQAPAFETSQLGNPRVNRKSLTEAELRSQLNPELPDKITFFGNSTLETKQLDNTRINRKSLNEAQINAQLNPEPQDKLTFFGNSSEPPPAENSKSKRKNTEDALRAQLRSPNQNKSNREFAPQYDGKQKPSRKSLTEASIKAPLNQKPNEKMNFFGNSPYKVTKAYNYGYEEYNSTENELKAQLLAQVASSNSRMNVFGNEKQLAVNVRTKPTKQEAREFRVRTPKTKSGKHAQRLQHDATQVYHIEVLEKTIDEKLKDAKTTRKDVKDHYRDHGFDNDFISVSNPNFATAHKNKKLPRRHGKVDPDGLITPSASGSRSPQLSSISTFNLLRDGSSVQSADVSEFERFSAADPSDNSTMQIDLSTLKLNNLDDRVGYRELHTLFPKAISIAAANEKDRHGKKTKRYNFVIFDNVSDAVKAMKRVNGRILHGLPLVLDYRRYALS